MATYYSDMVWRKTCVYRLYDADDRLLYVGLTMNPLGRMSKHRRRAWWQDVDRITMQWFDGREAAKAAEWRATGTDAPLYNITRPKWVAS